MNPHDAQTIALDLLRHHGLAHWQFRFNRRKRTLGLCYYDLKRIELSLHFVLQNDEAAVRDTVLHEIAHALAGQAAAHGPRWQEMCVRIGARPERCDRTASMPAGRWRAVCPGCGKAFHRYKRPQRNARYACRSCGPERGMIRFCLALE